jgi:hypothetical protein
LGLAFSSFLSNLAEVHGLDAVLVFGVVAFLASVVLEVAFSEGWGSASLSALSLVHLGVFVLNTLWGGMSPVALVLGIMVDCACFFASSSWDTSGGRVVALGAFSSIWIALGNFLLNALFIPRSATSVSKDHQAATPLPSALPLAESHMLSATQELESALHATHPPTKTAPKSTLLAMKSAFNKKFPSAIQILENAPSATTLPPDVSQLLLAKKHAQSTIMPSTSATGLMPPHNVLRTKTPK